ncbi:MAG: hypothetical protein ACFFCS_11585 [Candidatus Hodarchaeota archaeon]
MAQQIKISWKDEILSITHPKIADVLVEVNYIEAYCRDRSHEKKWGKTVIPHETHVLKEFEDGSRITLRSELADGVVVDHDIKGEIDSVSFSVTATNQSRKKSGLHWAQPCIRVSEFTGVEYKPSSEEYLQKCFIFVDGELERLPTGPWATKARYTPGQVWCPSNVDRRDVNPRPLSEIVPSNGLMGCFSKDEKFILATAWEPYQELFQGVLVCIHSDFRIGGLLPGQKKEIKGKIYIMEANIQKLLERYCSDFPEHHS